MMARPVAPVMSLITEDSFIQVSSSSFSSRWASAPWRASGGKIRRCLERDGQIVYLYLAATFVTVRAPIREDQARREGTR